jgi:L-fuculose-phosphate aldolase
MNADPAHDRARQDLAAAARRLESCGLNRGTSGNSSVRVEGGMLITASGIPADSLTTDDLVLVDADGAVDPRTAPGLSPSSEWRIHRAVYAARPDVSAVVHTHSTHAVALACLRREVPPFHYMVLRAGGPTIRCAAYATFGSEALSQATLSALDGRDACLMANHGMVAVGRSLDAALALAVEVEELCHQYLLALAAGGPVLLTDEELADARARFSSYGPMGDGPTR